MQGGFVAAIYGHVGAGEPRYWLVCRLEHTCLGGSPECALCLQRLSLLRGVTPGAFRGSSAIGESSEPNRLFRQRSHGL
jgi:hypothetical protein